MYTLTQHSLIAFAWAFVAEARAATEERHKQGDGSHIERCERVEVPAGHGSPPQVRRTLRAPQSMPASRMYAPTARPSSFRW